MRRVEVFNNSLCAHIHEADHQQQGDWKKLQSDAAVSDSDLRSFLNYAAQFLGNAGNYKSFGDSKFIPRASPESIAGLAKASPKAEKLWDQVKAAVYDTSSIAALHLGYPDDGHVSTYYPDSPGITKREIELVSDFLKDQGLMPENSRLRKTSAGNFELLIASAVTKPSVHDTKQSEWTLDGELKGKNVKLVFGDHAKEMVSASAS